MCILPENGKLCKKLQAPRNCKLSGIASSHVLDHCSTMYQLTLLWLPPVTATSADFYTKFYFLSKPNQVTHFRKTKH